MLSHSFYFGLKPFLPWRLRIVLRRILARRKRRTYRDVWPIDESAGGAPKGWPDWPEGKKFAVVLTHDVEGPDGLEKVQRLAELEMQLGVRSSFNFIPEGPYTVPPDLRAWLTGNGFEVGVHDLHHDGKLFASRRGFRRHAARINYYLREWGAAGFRSGFMVRNLDWMLDLNIQYDASTFDTDPFEIQPDGAGTIFPFWVESPAAPRGYVELPYTLPQDSTLFFLLREPGPAIWVRKLAWIADRGGMALVNVHPDYVRFDGERASARTFPVQAYADWLRHVGGQYAGQFWNPVPRALAAWFNGARTAAGDRLAVAPFAPPAPSGASARLRGKRAAVLLYSYYPSDPRPRRAAEAMVASGMTVDLFCLSESEREPREEWCQGVRVFRLPMKHRRDSKWTYLRQYARFLVASFWFLARRGLVRRYDVVHVHNMPDVLVFSALIPKLRGTRVMLDLHDPMPELMMTIFGSRERSLGIWLLKRLEKWSTRFADAVLTVNETCKKIFAARSCPAGKIHVVMNSPDEKIFRLREPPAPSPSPGANGRPFVVMYHGSLVHRHGLDLAVAALGRVRPSIPGAELRIYGQPTPYLADVMKSVQAGGLSGAIHYLGPQKLEQIVTAIGECDVGIIPNRRSIFTEINTPTRIFEYLSQGKPVVAPRAPGILDYFGPDDLIYFELGNADDLAAKIEQVFRDPAAAGRTVRRGQRIYQDHSWSSERNRFEQLVTTMVGAGEPAVPAAPAGGAAAPESGR